MRRLRIGGEALQYRRVILLVVFVLSMLNISVRAQFLNTVYRDSQNCFTIFGHARERRLAEVGSGSHGTA